MSIKHLYPTSTPSLNLNFKSSGVADPRLSCVRNSIGTYVDPASGLIKTAAANVARVDKDGLLVEETRDNQLPYSEDYSNWTLWNTTTAPSVSEPAPDGSTTCRKLTEGTTSAFTLMGEGSNMVNSTTYTYSFYIKKPGTNAARYCLVRTQGNSSPEICTFDMDTLDASNKPTVNVPSTPVATNIDFDVLPNGWFRFYCTFPCNAAGSNREMQIGINETDSITLQTYLGDGTSGFLVWGAQLEAGSFPTSYIPTSGSTVQRLADFCDLPLTGWWNPSVQTWTGDFQVYTTVVNKAIVTILSGSNRPLEFVANTGSGPSQTRIGTRNPWRSAYSELVPVNRTGFNKSAGTITASKVQAYLNGNKSSSPNPMTLPTGTFTTAHIGYYGTQATDQYNLNGTISRISYYPTEMSDTALQALTQ